ncbi:pyocin knob domain-containing protein [Halodurantibacterium flavum]|uniref:Pyocin knob domain-containing protein n=1 Tax=Halodurantibacterium flavum TaxID=1382802 RepID=A0ABW4S9K5_9RHOB
MAQTPSFTVENAAGAIVRGVINQVVASLVSLNSGTGAPPDTVPFMFWLYTGAEIPMLMMRNAADNGWIPLAEIEGGELRWIGALTDDPAQARALLQVARQQATTMDTTTGRGLLVGAFGLGATSTPYEVTDFNAAIRGGFFGAAAGAANGPAPTGVYAGFASFRNGGAGGTQVVTNINTGEIWHRARANEVWGAWQRFLREGYAEPLLGEWSHSGNVNQIDFTGLAGWSDIRVVFDFVVNNDATAVRVSYNNGASWQNTGYGGGVTDGVSATGSGDVMRLNRGGASGILAGEILLRNMSTPGRTVMLSQATTGSSRVPVAAYHAPDGVVNAIQIMNSTFSAGSVRVYGVRRA